MIELHIFKILIVSYCQPCPCPLIEETTTPTSKKLTEYDTDKMAQCSSTLLRNIRKLSRYDYSKFQLNNVTRSRVIELGIRKLHDDLVTQYCRSRAGTKLFHRIHTFVSQHRHFDILADSSTSICSAINQDTLHSITIKKLDKSKLFHIAHINAWLIRSKVLDFHEYISSRKVDLCAITESWLKPSGNLESKQIAPPGYSCISHPWSDGRIGGRIESFQGSHKSEKCGKCSKGDNGIWNIYV